MGKPLVQTLRDIGEGEVWNWDRLPPQREYLLAPEKFTVMSGGFGSGKTTGLLGKAMWLSLGIPNNLGYLGRYDGKALRASTMQSLRDMLHKDLVETWNDQQGFIQFKQSVGGSRIIYGDFKDLHDLQNIPLGWFGIDQMEEVPFEVWKYLAGRLRRRTPILNSQGLKQYLVKGACRKQDGRRHYALEGQVQCRFCKAFLSKFDESISEGQPYADWDLIIYRRYGFGVCNPEGPAHWIYELFPGLPGPHGLSEGNGDRDYKAFHVTIYDGLKAGFIDREYVDPLERLYASVPHMRDRYLFGKWVEAVGLVYPGWDRGQNLINRMTTRYDGSSIVPEKPTIYEYVDPAPASPTAVGWLMIEDCTCGCERQNFWLLDEHYEAQKPISYHCSRMKMVRDKWGITPQATYMDSNGFSRTQVGQKGSPREDQLFSLADEYGDYGIWPLPTQKDWEAGFNRITELLALDPSHRHPITGQYGAPHFFALSGCKWFMKEIETYKWKVVRNQQGSITQDEPQDKRDHHMDGINGLLASRPVPDYSHRYDEERKRQEKEDAWYADLGDQVTPSNWMSA